MRWIRLPSLMVAVVLLSPLGRAHDGAASSSDVSTSTTALAETLPPWQRVLDSASQEHVDSLQSLITEMRGQGCYAKAIGPAEEELRIRRAAQGDDHWETGDAVRLIATLRHVASLPAESQARLAEADRSDDEVRRLFAERDYEGATAVVRRALTARREILGDDHIEVAITLDDLAAIAWNQGDYARAEPLFRQALLVNRTALGTDHPNLARAMNNLAALLAVQLKCDAARDLLLEAVAMNRRLLGERDPRVMSSSGNLAVLHFDGDLDEAERLLRETVSLEREVYGEHSSLRLARLRDLILVLQLKRNLSAAAPLLDDALALCQGLPREQDPLRTDILMALTGQRRAMGNFVAAEESCRRALAIDMSVGGPCHPDVVRDRYRLAELLHLQGKYAAAERAWANASESFEAARLHTTFEGLARIHYSGALSPFAGFAVCLARSGKSAEAWEQLESHFARSLSDEIADRCARPLTRAEREERQAHLDALAALDDQINSLRNASDSTAGASALLDSLLLARETRQAGLSGYEKDLADRYGGSSSGLVELDTLQAHVEPDQALLAWVDMAGDPHAADPNGEHWACVVRHSGNPQWIRLPGSGLSGAWTSDDDSVAVLLREALQHPPQETGGEAVTVLCQWVHKQRIAPLEDALQGAGHLVVVPAGWMAGVPVEALTDDYLISYAPSATVHVAMCERRESSKPPRSLLALGDPILGAAVLAERDVTRVEEVALRSDGYRPLPGTRAEVEAIAQVFQNAGYSTPTVLLGSEAREQRLCGTVSSGKLSTFGVLHFATHAVVNDRVPLQSALVLSREDPRGVVERAIQGEAVYDGVVTAEQILRTWQLDADLVTLSACETALGRDSGGEGYLGFSQVLFAAGARSLIASLWKVDDTATCLLMTRFYENLLGRQESPRVIAGRMYDVGMALPKVDALAEAKTWLRELTWDDPELRTTVTRFVSRGLVPVDEPSGVPGSQHPFADPRYWAAFILMGDPR